MAPPLENYLRTHRKRAGLAQRDVAFLLGARSGSRVSRHERFERRPTLEVALAYEAIFRTPVAELFTGLKHEVTQFTLARATELLDSIDIRRLTALEAGKVEHLGRLANVPVPPISLLQ